MGEITVLISIFVLFFGIGWGISYVLLIRRAYLDKTFGMPMTAACLNIAWEFSYAFIFPGVKIAQYVNMTWFFLDVIIVYQIFLYGKNEFKGISSKQFYASLIAMLIAAFLTVYCLEIEPIMQGGPVYASYNNTFSEVFGATCANLLLSFLFIPLLLRRNSIAGQSMYIVLSRMIGSIGAEVAVTLYLPYSPILILLSIEIFILDLIYSIMLYRKCKASGINPWRRL